MRIRESLQILHAGSEPITGVGVVGSGQVWVGTVEGAARLCSWSTASYPKCAMLQENVNVSCRIAHRWHRCYRSTAALRDWCYEFLSGGSWWRLLANDRRSFLTDAWWSYLRSSRCNQGRGIGRGRSHCVGEVYPAGGAGLFFMISEAVFLFL